MRREKNRHQGLAGAAIREERGVGRGNRGIFRRTGRWRGGPKFKVPVARQEAVLSSLRPEVRLVVSRSPPSAGPFMHVCVPVCMFPCACVSLKKEGDDRQGATPHTCPDPGAAERALRWVRWPKPGRGRWAPGGECPSVLGHAALLAKGALAAAGLQLGELHL